MAIEKLTDEDFMPFGKYLGVKLACVPASYLLWYKDQKWEKNIQVMAYIEDNMMALLQEADLERINKQKDA